MIAVFYIYMRKNSIFVFWGIINSIGYLYSLMYILGINIHITRWSAY